MKKLLMWAVLCTATTAFAMGESFEQGPPSPGKIASEEDLKALLLATQARSPEEPRSASSSPIPVDPSQEEAIPAAANSAPSEHMQDFQPQFKLWIEARNVAAFRDFLGEHFVDAEKYISDNIVTLARQKKEESESEESHEIYNILQHLKFGKDHHLGDMEKIEHHTFYGEATESRQSNGNVCEAEMLVIDTADCGSLPNFFQQKSALNIVLRDLIEQQNFYAIFDLVYELTKCDNCDLQDIISDKTKDVAFEKMNKEKTKTSQTIYCIINELYDDIPKGESDTTAEALARVFTELDNIKLSEQGKRKMAQSKLLTYIENSDFNNIERLLSSYEDDAQAAKNISHDILKTAEIMRDRVFDLQKLMYDSLIGERVAHKASEVCRRLEQTVYNPVPVIYILSDEEETGPVYSEGQLDAQRIPKLIKEAFSLSTVESIVSPEKAEIIMQYLAAEKKKKKQGEQDWESPQSSPSQGLRVYLGSFKPLSIPD